MTEPAAQGSRPRPNVEIVQRVYDAFARRDVAAAMAELADEVVITQSTEVPWGGTFRGHEGALQFFGGLLGAITSQVTFERFVDAGDHVVAIGWTRGTVNESGNPFDVPVAHVWELRDGKAVRIHFCIDNPTMRAALG